MIVMVMLFQNIKNTIRVVSQCYKPEKLFSYIIILHIKKVSETFGALDLIAHSML